MHFIIHSAPATPAPPPRARFSSLSHHRSVALPRPSPRMSQGGQAVRARAARNTITLHFPFRRGLRIQRSQRPNKSRRSTCARASGPCERLLLPARCSFCRLRAMCSVQTVFPHLATTGPRPTNRPRLFPTCGEWPGLKRKARPAAEGKPRIRGPIHGPSRTTHEFTPRSGLDVVQGEAPNDSLPPIPPFRTPRGYSCLQKLQPHLNPPPLPPPAPTGTRQSPAGVLP